MKRRLDQLLSSLGYGGRSEVKKFIKAGLVTVNGQCIKKSDIKVSHEEVRFEGEVLDPAPGMVIMMHKPVGMVCSHDDSEGITVYSLLPKRWLQRNPKLSTIGRLDKDTSGLLLITDDGELIHALTSPKKKVSKVYEVTLEQPLSGKETEIFASGTLTLKGEKTACLPAVLEIRDVTHVALTITEGRYHQVRRMFAAVGNHVAALHRSRVGNLQLDTLEAGEYRIVDIHERSMLVSDRD